MNGYLKTARGSLARVLLLIAASVGSAALSFLTQLLCAHTLSVGDYGQLVALLAVISIVAVFGGYGVGWFWLQAFGREGRVAFRWLPQSIRLLASASTIGAVLLVLYAGMTSEAVIALLLVPILVGQAFSETTTARFQLEERFVALGLWQSAASVGRFVVTLALISLGFTAVSDLLAGFAAVALIMLTVSAVSLVQFFRERVVLAGQASIAAAPPYGAVTPTAALRATTPYCFCTIFYLVYSQGVVAIVERSLGSEAAARYNIAFLIIAAIYLVPSVIYMKYLVAKIFRWSAHDPKMFSAVIHVGVAGGAVLGVLCMIVVMFSARWVIPVLFGEHYAGAVPILIILALGIPIRFVQHAYGAAFFSEENMKRKVWCLGGAACTCLAVSAALIPFFGVIGAAVASVCSELALLFLFMYGVARHVCAIDISSSLSIKGFRAALDSIGNRAVATVNR